MYFKNIKEHWIDNSMIPSNRSDYPNTLNHQLKEINNDLEKLSQNFNNDKAEEYISETIEKIMNRHREISSQLEQIQQNKLKETIDNELSFFHSRQEGFSYPQSTQNVINNYKDLLKQAKKYHNDEINEKLSELKEKTIDHVKNTELKLPEIEKLIGKYKDIEGNQETTNDVRKPNLELKKLVDDVKNVEWQWNTYYGSTENLKLDELSHLIDNARSLDDQFSLIGHELDDKSNKNFAADYVKLLQRIKSDSKKYTEGEMLDQSQSLQIARMVDRTISDWDNAKSDFENVRKQIKLDSKSTVDDDQLLCEKLEKLNKISDDISKLMDWERANRSKTEDSGYITSAKYSILKHHSS